MLFILFDPILDTGIYSTCIRPDWQEYRDCQVNPVLIQGSNHIPPTRAPAAATTTTTTTTKPVTTTTTTHHPENTMTEDHSTTKAGKTSDKSSSSGISLHITLYFELI